MIGVILAGRDQHQHPRDIPGVTEPLTLRPTHLGSPAPLLSALVPLPAVGPPLLTLVNFEVENLAYMLVCMQWAVSGVAQDPGHTAAVAGGGASGDSTCP